MSFQDNLRRYREAQGLSARDLAKQVGISHNTYSHYENAQVEPRFSTLIKIATALHVSIDDLLDYRPNKLEYWIKFISRQEMDVETDKENVLISVYVGNGETSQIAISKDEFVEKMNTYNRFAHEAAKREIEDITLSHFTEYFMGKIFEDTSLSEEEKIAAMYEAGKGLNLWPEITSVTSEHEKAHMIFRFMRHLNGNVEA